MSSPQRPGPAQLLLDLVADPRDQGYEAAARRRAEGSLRRPRWLDQGAMALGCALIGFVVVVAYVHTHRSAPEATQVRQSLIERVQAAQHTGRQLTDQLHRLNDQLGKERDRALAGSGLVAGLDRAQLLAGQVAVTGPGLQVVLSEPAQPTPSAAPGRRVPVAPAAGNILTDRDVRSVVNELWAVGAEAIAVNNIRLLPTSAIRFAGDAVLVDLQPVTPPYTISAVGAADALAVGFAGSDVASRYQTLSSARGIGFRFTEKEKMTLPAGAPITPRYAHEPGGGGR